jgi:hypothetical protein
MGDGYPFKPHTDPDECFSWHDSCQCTPETCNGLWEQLDKAEHDVERLRFDMRERLNIASCALEKLSMGHVFTSGEEGEKWMRGIAQSALDEIEE